MPIKIVAHRGASEEYPENSLAVTLLCLKIGIDVIEIDVRGNICGKLYNFHDEFLNRSTNGHGFFGISPTFYLKSLFLKDSNGGVTKERIPLIEELLDTAVGNMDIFFDIKSGSIRKLVKLINKYNLEHRCFFWFKSKKKSLKFRKKYPELKVKINVSTSSELKLIKQENTADIVEISYSKITEEFMDSAREHGLKVMVRYGGNDESAFEKIHLLKPDYANIDYPEWLLEKQKSESIMEPK